MRKKVISWTILMTMCLSFCFAPAVGFAGVGENPAIPEIFTNKAIPDNFKEAGDVVDFKISVELPKETADYEGLLIHNELPAALTYKGSSAEIIVPGESNISLVALQSGGKIRLSLSKQQMESYKGRLLELTVQTEVNSHWSSGSIESKAEYYAQTKTIRPIPGITAPLCVAVAEVKVKEEPGPVGAVTKLKGKGLSYQTIKLSWSSAKNATGYEIYRFDSKKKKYKKVKTIKELSSFFKNTKLKPNKTYKYKVRAFQTENGETKYGSFSKAITAKTKKTGPQKIVAKAKTKLGCPYKSGGIGPNAFDCSGFVYWTFKNAGVKTKKKVKRGSSASMYSSLKKYTVSKGLGGMKKAKKGDIILFKRGGHFSHAAIYIGDGKLIHATRPGKVVKIQKVSTIHNSGTRVAVFIRIAKK